MKCFIKYFFFFIQPVFIFPIFYLFFFGMNFLLYISLINKKSLLRLFFDDLLILIAFVVRFFGQFIRIFLILSAFFSRRIPKYRIIIINF